MITSLNDPKVNTIVARIANDLYSITTDKLQKTKKAEENITLNSFPSPTVSTIFINKIKTSLHATPLILPRPDVYEEESNTILSFTTSSSGVVTYNNKCTQYPCQSSPTKRYRLNELEEDSITRPPSLNSNHAYIKSKDNKTKIDRVLNPPPIIAMILHINKTQYPSHSLLSQCSRYNPLKENNNNVKGNSESNSKNNNLPNQHNSIITNGDNNCQHTTESIRYLCTNEFCKGNNSEYKYKEQPLCEDIGCKVQEEGEYLTKKNCHQYAKKFPRYSYIDEYCKGNDYEYTYINELFCEDIGCEDQKEGRCTTTEEYEKTKYILILRSFAKVTIAYANIRDNHFVKILDVQF